MKPGSASIQVNKIKLENGVQPRVKIDEDTVQEYVSRLKEGVAFPPIELVFDGVDYYLWDGFHRLLSHKAAGKAEINCNITDGTRRDAVLKAVGANAQHGLRRSISDKRKAVETLLKDEEWSKWSDREIARQCVVSHVMVGDRRVSLTGSSSSEATRMYTTKHGSKAEMKTGGISAANTVRPALKSPPRLPASAKPETSEDASVKSQQKKWDELKRHLETDVYRRFVELSKEPLGVFLDDNKLQEVKGKLANVVEVARDTKPHAECPYCEGRGCRICRNSGYVPQHIHRNAPKKGEGK